MNNPTFISFISLEYEDEPSNSEELADLIYSEPVKPTKKVDMMIPMHEIEQVHRHRVFDDLTEVRTYGQEILIIDEHFKLFKKRLLDLNGQEPKQTWSDQDSDDKLIRIRTYHN